MASFDQHITSMIARSRRRLFVKRFVRVLAIAIAWTAAICGILYALSRIGFDLPCAIWLIALIPWLAASLYAWPWKTPPVEIARQIDKANRFGDRLSSSIAFMRESAPTEWMKIQIGDTAQKLESEDTRKAFIDKAFAVQKPVFIRISAAIAAATILVAFLPDIQSLVSNTLINPESSPNDEAHAVEQPNLDPTAQALRQDQLEKILESADTADDPELEEAAKELEQILKDDRDGKLSPEEFQKRLAALQQKLEQSDQAPTQEEQKAIDESIREAVQTLTQMKEDPETQELAKSLENNDYDKAADILRDLLKSTDPKDKKKLEKLAKMFGDLAKNLDPTDPKLKEALKKNKDLVNDLKKEFDDDKLSDEDKKAFKDAAEKLKNTENQQNQQGQQGDRKTQNQQDADNKASKTIDKLQKAFDKQSKSLDSQSKSDENGEQPKEQEKYDPNAQEQAQNPDNVKDAPKQGNQGQQEQTGEQGQTQNDAGQEGQDAENALRDVAEQKKAQQQRDALNDLADKMRKDAQHNDQQASDEQAEERKKNVEDFMDRAKGKDPQEQPDPQDSRQQDQQQQDQQQQGQQGSEQKQGQQPQADEQQQGEPQNQQQQGQQGSEQKQGQQPQADEQQQGEPQNQQPQGQQQAAEQQQGQQPQGQQQAGAEQGEQIGSQEQLGMEPSHGKGHDTSEGDATSMNVNLKDEKLTGMDSGETTSEIIESAGQKGFASESYKEVYQTYEKAAESVLESESTPQGYRNYVEKYFDMIRPQ